MEPLNWVENQSELISIDNEIKILGCASKDLEKYLFSVKDITQLQPKGTEMVQTEVRCILKLCTNGMSSLGEVLEEISSLTNSANSHMGIIRNTLETIDEEKLSECQTLLTKMGIPYYVVDSLDFEAESVCASLCESKHVDFVMSEDSDACLFGDLEIPIIQKYHKDKNDPWKVLEVDLRQACIEMGLSKSEFLDLCILSGCDFSSTIVGIGPAKGYKLIKQFGSIEKILENNTKLETRELFNPELARDVFKRKWIPPTNFLLNQSNIQEIYERKKNHTNELSTYKEFNEWISQLSSSKGIKQRVESTQNIGSDVPNFTNF